MIEVGEPAAQDSDSIPRGVERVNRLPRLIVAVLVFTCALNGRAQVESPPKFSLQAIVYDKVSLVPLQDVLLIVIDNTGRTDSLFTDAYGVARTAQGADTLGLPGGRLFTITASKPNSFRVIDQLATDTLHESTVFAKEYYLQSAAPTDGCGSGVPKVYFQSHTASTRMDSGWYQQEDRVNSAAEALAIVVRMMNDNPTMIIKVMGYCDVHEKDCHQLALARATYVKKMLEAEGIPAARIQAEGRSDDHYYSKADIAKMKKHEREICLARDRRVDYVVVGWIDEP